MTIELPAATGVNVLEPSQTRYMRIDLPEGLGVNTSSADGLDTCSAEQVGFEENVASQCPDGAKLASTEFDIPVLRTKAQRRDLPERAGTRPPLPDLGRRR